MENKPKTEEVKHFHKEWLTEKQILLRQKLNEKARKEPIFRFYSLYEKVCRFDILLSAYQIVKSNKGSAGIDGITFSKIESHDEGITEFLKRIQGELKAKKYKPKPVKRVYIPKSNGKQRPLGIPTIKDRVVQMAALLIIEPIFEADFKDCSYGFRPNRSAHDALSKIQSHIQAGYNAVYDADLKGYFDSIPHDNLLKCVEKRIADKTVLRLIRLWLKVPVIEIRKDGKSEVKRSDKGTPQGGVISPLLANIYLHCFDRHFYSEKGAGVWANAKLVRYADDFVVLARYQTKRLKEYIEWIIEDKLNLEINRDKTKVIELKKDRESLDFLGFTFRYDKDLYNSNNKYLNVFPSKKTEEREREKLRGMINSKVSFVPLPTLIAQVNRHLKGWKNYFNFGYPRKSFRKMNSFVRIRFTKFLERKSQRPFQPKKGQSYYELFDMYQLIYL